VRRLRLWHALSASAAVHLALLAGLLALAHPAASIVPRLRVSLLGAPRQAGGEGVAARPEPGGREGRAESASAASSAGYAATWRTYRPPWSRSYSEAFLAGAGKGYAA